MTDDQRERDRESYSRSGNGRDPTPNVQDLVRLAMERQDDLRNMEARHVQELMQRDRDHAKEMRKAESDRIDAIRAVDVGAVQRAAEVQAAQQQALAAQVATTADAFRVSLAAALAPITTSVDDLRTKDIADLRRAQYEAQGQKTQVVETRDVKSETRLNLNVLIGALILALALYAALHK